MLTHSLPMANTLVVGKVFSSLDTNVFLAFLMHFDEKQNRLTVQRKLQFVPAANALIEEGMVAEEVNGHSKGGDPLRILLTAIQRGKGEKKEEKTNSPRVVIKGSDVSRRQPPSTARARRNRNPEAAR